MPLRRTPPPYSSAPAVAAYEDSSIAVPRLTSPLTRQHCESDPELATLSREKLERGACNVIHRLKRRRDSAGEELTEFMAEMKNMFKEFRVHQNSQDVKMEKISSAMDEIKAQNLAMQTSVEFVANKFDTLQLQINNLVADRNKNLQFIQILEQKMEKFEQQKRSTCVEVKNIPHIKGETKLSLLKQLATLANILDTPINSQYVKDIFRINTKDPSNKTIIINFNSVLTKEHMIRKYRDYNKSNNNSKLNTETLGIGGPRNLVYISENLSPHMKWLHYIAKEYAKSNGFKHCWVTNGKIFLRKQEGAGAILISSEQDLKNVDTSGTNN